MLHRKVHSVAAWRIAVVKQCCTFCITHPNNKEKLIAFVMCTMSNCAESEAHGTKNYWEKFDKLD